MGGAFMGPCGSSPGVCILTLHTQAWVAHSFTHPQTLNESLSLSLALRNTLSGTGKHTFPP